MAQARKRLGDKRVRRTASGARLVDQAGIRHSWEFTPGPNGGVEYTLRGIPSKFWRRVRAKAKREQVSMRSIVLQLLRQWISRDDSRAA